LVRRGRACIVGSVVNLALWVDIEPFRSMII
jgi:hypothetical protein